MVFDCDGVLVDSERLVTRLEADEITALGWPLTPADVIERFVGRSEAYMLAEIDRFVAGGVPDGWYDGLRARTHDLFRAELVPVDGAVNAVRAVGERHATCVASSSGHDRLRLVLGIVGLLDTFAGRIHGAEDVRRGKPAPDLFLHTAAAEGYPPGDCVVVEDSVPGVRAGVAAGMRVLGYGGGLTAPALLAGAGATVFTDMRELPGLV